MTTQAALDQNTDDELALLVGAADRGVARNKAQWAFETLHRRYAGLVMAVIHNKLRCCGLDSAADVSQAIWMEVWNSAGTRFSGGNFRGWLTTIARNRAIDELRRPRARQIAEGHDVAAPVDESSSVELRQQALRDCLQRLDHNRREVVELWLAQKSHEEISRQLQIEPGTSMSRLSRAKQLLKDCVRSKLP
ncbi:MAG: sigma-70 family RNA polymerase sigma factor [Thermoguttaceae bacterium]|jgi:RNA polymerase sigma-70 factor (ECF subfamily)